MGKHNRKCQIYFFPFFSTQVSPEVQISRGKKQEINDLSSRAPSSSLPSHVPESSFSSRVPQQQTASVPMGSAEMSASQSSLLNGSLPGSTGFVPHQLLPILDISISSHPLTICHRRPINSLSYVSHTRISLNHCYPKGKEKINAWIIVMPRKTSVIPARLFDLKVLSRALTITGSISLHSKGRARFYGGNFQLFRKL